MSWNQPKFCHCGKPGEVLFVSGRVAECGFCELINEHIAKFKEEEKKMFRDRVQTYKEHEEKMQNFWSHHQLKR